jgi:hypothetical protein
MGLEHSPSIVMNGLVLAIDAANSRCYSGSGLTLYDLASGIGATLVGGVGFSTSGSGSFNFDGTNDYINIPNDSRFTNTTNLSINMWVRSNFTTSRYSDLIGKGTSDSDEEYTILFASNTIYFDVGGASGPYIQTSYSTTAQTWYNVCCTHSRSGGNSDLKLYVNGSNVAATTLAPTAIPIDNNSNITIGQRYNSGSSASSSYSGLISQVQIYNKTLTAQEVRQNYNATKKRYGL